MKKYYEERLMSINWFFNLGKQNVNELNDLSIRFEYLKNKNELENKISSLRWENKRIEEQAIVTNYLFNHHREKRKLWNIYAEEARVFINMYLIDNWKKFQNENNLPEEFIYSVMWNILHYLIISKFNEEMKDIPTFYLELIKIYEVGHVPCGWSGKKDKGFLFVY